MARLRGALGSLRARVANCSIRTAFALYAAAAMLAGLALSVVASGLLGYLAEASLPEDPYAHAGYYVLDADAGELVPAEALSWYETPAYDAVAERGAGGGDSVVLYVASRSDSGRLPVPLDDPPAGVRDGSAQDLALLMDEEDADGIRAAEQAAAENALVRDSVHALGVPAGRELFMTMSFISLPVIPHLKLTTLGLVDVDRQIRVPLLMKEE